MKPCLVLGLAFVLSAGAALASSPPTGALTPEQAVKLRRVSDLHFSPDGSSLVCVVSSATTAGTLSHLWHLEVRGGEFRQLTFSEKSELKPRWAPDGKSLAFLSNRDGQMQIYGMLIGGGEASPLTAAKEGVSALSWSPDGAQIAFLAKEPKTELDLKRERQKDDGKVADREQDLERLWILDVASRKARQVTSGAFRVDEFEWLGTNRILAIGTQRPKVDTRWTSAIYEVTVSNGTVTLFVQPNQPFGQLTVPRGRKQFSFVGTRSAGPIPHDLFLGSSATKVLRDATSSIDRPVLESKWQDDDNAIVRVADGFRYRLYGLVANRAPQSIPVPFSVRAFDLARDGTLAFVGVDFTHLPELFLQPPKGTIRQVSRHRSQGAGLFG